MRTLLAALLTCFLLSACKPRYGGPPREELQPLLGRSVEQVVSVLHIPRSSLRAGDEPPGVFRLVSADLPGEPVGTEITIYVARDAAVVSRHRRVSADELLSKAVIGIAISYPERRKAPDMVVGDVIWYYHNQP